MTHQFDRRKFFIVVASFAAAAFGIVTSDYWYPTMKRAYMEIYARSFPESVPAPISTVIITPEETSTLTPTSPTTLTTQTPTPTEAMSEDEVMVRGLLSDWVEAFNGKNTTNILNLYTEDAKVYFFFQHSLRDEYKGRAELSWYFAWHAAHESKINNFTVRELRITNDQARMSGFYYLIFSGQPGCISNFEYELVKISEISRGQTKFKLPKPIWRISYETFDVIPP